LLLSVSLGRNEQWRGARKTLLWLANLSWVSVLLLIAKRVYDVVFEIFDVANSWLLHRVHEDLRKELNRGG
jgi:hypothetical protein